MEFGISTASLFKRKTTEEALEFLSKNNVPIVEVFLASYYEYRSEYGEQLKNLLGNTKVHSIHTLTTQFEPQLYSVNKRAKDDSFMILKDVLSVGQNIGAKNYTFHGGARYKKTKFAIDYEKVGKETQDIIDLCLEYGISLTYENVHWGYYNYIGFFKELKKRCPMLKGVLDIKQAYQSEIDYVEYVKEMGESIKTIHLSDMDENGKLCLPGRGSFDFKKMFTVLKDYGFDGGVILEVYSENYGEEKELFESLDYLREISKT